MRLAEVSTRAVEKEGGDKTRMSGNEDTYRERRAAPPRDQRDGSARYHSDARSREAAQLAGADFRKG